jgi:hypothetical protein
MLSYIALHKNNMFRETSLLVVMMFLCGGCAAPVTASLTPSPPSSVISENLASLNEWDHEELDVYECPSRHPGREAAGETGGWIISHKQALKDLGVYVRWNCETKAFEITTEENQTSLCGCK